MPNEKSEGHQTPAKKLTSPLNRKRTWDLPARSQLTGSPFRRLAQQTQPSPFRSFKSPVSSQLHQRDTSSQLKYSGSLSEVTTEDNDDIVDWIKSMKQKAVSILKDEEEEEKRFYEELEREKRIIEAQEEINTEAFDKLKLYLDSERPHNQEALAQQLEDHHNQQPVHSNRSDYEDYSESEPYNDVQYQNKYSEPVEILDSDEEDANQQDESSDQYQASQIQAQDNSDEEEESSIPDSQVIDVSDDEEESEEDEQPNYNPDDFQDESVTYHPQPQTRSRYASLPFENRNEDREEDLSEVEYESRSENEYEQDNDKSRGLVEGIVDPSLFEHFEASDYQDYEHREQQQHLTINETDASQTHQDFSHFDLLASAALQQISSSGVDDDHLPNEYDQVHSASEDTEIHAQSDADQENSGYNSEESYEEDNKVSESERDEPDSTSNHSRQSFELEEEHFEVIQSTIENNEAEAETEDREASDESGDIEDAPVDDSESLKAKNDDVKAETSEDKTAPKEVVEDEAFEQEEVKEEQYYDSENDQLFEDPSASLFGDMTVDDLQHTLDIAEDIKSESENDQLSQAEENILDAIEQDTAEPYETILPLQVIEDDDEEMVDIDDVVPDNQDRGEEQYHDIPADIPKSPKTFVSFFNLTPNLSSSDLSFAQVSDDFVKNIAPAFPEFIPQAPRPVNDNFVPPPQPVQALDKPKEEHSVEEDDGEQIEIQPSFNANQSLDNTSKDKPEEPLGTIDDQVPETTVDEKTGSKSESFVARYLKKIPLFKSVGGDDSMNVSLPDENENLEHAIESSSIKNTFEKLVASDLENALGETPEKFIDDVVEGVKIASEEFKNDTGFIEKSLGETPEKFVDDVAEGVQSISEEVSRDLENVVEQSLGETPEQFVQDVVEGEKQISQVLQRDADEFATSTLGERPEEFIKDTLEATEELAERVKENLDADIENSLGETAENFIEDVKDATEKTVDEIKEASEKISREVREETVNEIFDTALENSLGESAEEFVSDITGAIKRVKEDIQANQTATSTEEESDNEETSNTDALPSAADALARFVDRGIVDPFSNTTIDTKSDDSYSAPNVADVLTNLIDRAIDPFDSTVEKTDTDISSDSPSAPNVADILTNLVDRATDPFDTTVESVNDESDESDESIESDESSNDSIEVDAESTEIVGESTEIEISRPVSSSELQSAVRHSYRPLQPSRLQIAHTAGDSSLLESSLVEEDKQEFIRDDEADDTIELFETEDSTPEINTEDIANAVSEDIRVDIQPLVKAADQDPDFIQINGKDDEGKAETDREPSPEYVPIFGESDSEAQDHDASGAVEEQSSVYKASEHVEEVAEPIERLQAFPKSIANAVTEFVNEALDISIAGTEEVTQVGDFVEGTVTGSPKDPTEESNEETAHTPLIDVSTEEESLKESSEDAKSAYKISIADAATEFIDQAFDVSVVGENSISDSTDSSKADTSNTATGGFRSTFKRGYDWVFGKSQFKKSKAQKIEKTELKDDEVEDDKPEQENFDVEMGGIDDDKVEKTPPAQEVTTPKFEHIIMKTRSGKILGANTAEEIAQAEIENEREEELIEKIAHGEVVLSSPLKTLAEDYEKIEHPESERRLGGVIGEQEINQDITQDSIDESDDSEVQFLTKEQFSGGSDEVDTKVHEVSEDKPQVKADSEDEVSSNSEDESEPKSEPGSESESESEAESKSEFSEPESIKAEEFVPRRSTRNKSYPVEIEEPTRPKSRGRGRGRGRGSIRGRGRGRPRKR